MQTIKNVFEGTHADWVPHAILAAYTRTGARDVGASLVLAVAVRGAGRTWEEGVCPSHPARRHQARQERGGKPHVGAVGHQRSCRGALGQRRCRRGTMALQP